MPNLDQVFLSALFPTGRQTDKERLLILWPVTAIGRIMGISMLVSLVSTVGERKQIEPTSASKSHAHDPSCFVLFSLNSFVHPPTTFTLILL